MNMFQKRETYFWGNGSPRYRTCVNKFTINKHSDICIFGLSLLFDELNQFRELSASI